MEDVIVGGLNCPKCGRAIFERFLRFSPPIPYTCKRGCRLVIVLDAEGDQHKVSRVPSEVSLEAYALALADPGRLIKAAGGLTDLAAFLWNDRLDEREETS